ncbi:MAG TPA: NAD-dependent epimerase/dehydratase family protein [Candidatus Limnocylindrales bacterium]|nr:NAD-dependent epimerase/dehydratase family protein [Candidatus Limnocylindrales bacterium]
MTGGSGFVGRVLARRLVAHGDDVTVSVRNRSRVAELAELDGTTIVEDDLTDVRRLADALRGHDAVIHAAGSYRVGIARTERGAMWDANIGATTRVLDAVEVAGIPRIVYLSTCSVLGDTHGRVVDESWRRDIGDGFVSWYDETKFGAHEVAQQRARAGAPVVTVLPSQVYGPGDHSAIGAQLRDAYRGTLRYRALEEAGLGFVHVEDLAAGILAAVDRGRVGESYILSGPQVRLADATRVAAELGGQRLPPVIPTSLLRLLVPIGGLIGRPGLAELVASAGATFWGSSAKAEAELGFSARSLEDGLRATFGLPARDLPPAAPGTDPA